MFCSHFIEHLQINLLTVSNPLFEWKAYYDMVHLKEQCVHVMYEICMRVSVQLTTENLRQLEAADGYDRMGYRTCSATEH